MVNFKQESVGLDGAILAHPDRPRPEALKNLVRVEGITQSVADVVDTQDGQKNHETRDNGGPGGGKYLIERIFEHVAPGCRRRLNAKAQKAETGLGNDGIGDTETGRYDDGSQGVG